MTGLVVATYSPQSLDEPMRTTGENRAGLMGDLVAEAVSTGAPLDTHAIVAFLREYANQPITVNPNGILSVPCNWPHAAESLVTGNNALSLLAEALGTPTPNYAESNQSLGGTLADLAYNSPSVAQVGVVKDTLYFTPLAALDLLSGTLRPTHGQPSLPTQAAAAPQKPEQPPTPGQQSVFAQLTTEQLDANRANVVKHLEHTATDPHHRELLQRLLTNITREQLFRAEPALTKTLESQLFSRELALLKDGEILTVGRALESTVPIVNGDDTVSRNHFEIANSDNGYLITVKGSTQATINNHQVAPGIYKVPTIISLGMGTNNTTVTVDQNPFPVAQEKQVVPQKVPVTPITPHADASDDTITAGLRELWGRLKNPALEENEATAAKVLLTSYTKERLARVSDPAQQHALRYTLMSREIALMKDGQFIMIGSGDSSNIPLPQDETSISQEQCSILKHEGQLYLTNHGQGTVLINNAQVMQGTQVPIGPGDTIQLGNNKLPLKLLPIPFPNPEAISQTTSTPPSATNTEFLNAARFMARFSAETHALSLPAADGTTALWSHLKLESVTADGTLQFINQIPGKAILRMPGTFDATVTEAQLAQVRQLNPDFDATVGKYLGGRMAISSKTVLLDDEIVPEINHSVRVAFNQAVKVTDQDYGTITGFSRGTFLIRSVQGSNQTTPEELLRLNPDFIVPGTPVSVMDSRGSITPGYRVAHYDDTVGEFVVRKTHEPSGATLEKRIGAGDLLSLNSHIFRGEEFLNQNPHFLEVGSSVLLPTGEHGVFLGMARNGDALVQPHPTAGVVPKSATISLSVDELILHNRQLFLGEDPLHIVSQRSLSYTYRSGTTEDSKEYQMRIRGQQVTVTIPNSCDQSTILSKLNSYYQHLNPTFRTSCGGKFMLR